MVFMVSLQSIYLISRKCLIRFYVCKQVPSLKGVQCRHQNATNDVVAAHVHVHVRIGQLRREVSNV